MGEIREEELAGGMVIVSGFNSFEEQVEYMRQKREAAISNIVPLQRTIELGGYACNVQHLGNPDIGPIFGAIESAEEVAAWNQLYYGVGDLEAARRVLAKRNEFPPPSTVHEPGKEYWKEDGFESGEQAVQDAVTNHITEYLDGYLFGNWLSKACPESELGSGHASVCIPVSQEVYLDAKANGGLISWEHATELNATLSVLRTQLKEAEENRGEGDDHSHR